MVGHCGRLLGAHSLTHLAVGHLSRCFNNRPVFPLDSSLISPKRSGLNTGCILIINEKFHKVNPLMDGVIKRRLILKPHMV